MWELVRYRLEIVEDAIENYTTYTRETRAFVYCPLVRRQDRHRPVGVLFHYSDGTGDFGWHHHPQEYVEGWGHFQERSNSETAYTYEPYAFSSKNPTRVVWEVLSRLTSELETE